MAVEDLPASARAAGAFGEWAVVVELLRRGWIPANVNQTVKNNDGFDILARKGSRTVSLSVKTRRPHVGHFQIGGFRPGVELQPLPYDNSEFTILVSMADKRGDDCFYVVPSHVVRAECILRQREHRERPTPSREIGKWNLILADRRDGQQRGGVGMAKKWASYRENWKSLEKAEAK